MAVICAYNRCASVLGTIVMALVSILELVRAASKLMNAASVNVMYPFNRVLLINLIGLGGAIGGGGGGGAGGGDDASCVGGKADISCCCGCCCVGDKGLLVGSVIALEFDRPSPSPLGLVTGAATSVVVGSGLCRIPGEVSKLKVRWRSSGFSIRSLSSESSCSI